MGRYLVLLRVLQRRGLPAEARALRSALVLPPDRTTRLVSDTLNLSRAAGTVRRGAARRGPDRRRQRDRERGGSRPQFSQDTLILFKYEV